MAAAEVFLPLRRLSTSTATRWTSNLVLAVASTAVGLLLFQATGIALALKMRALSYGALTRSHLPYAAQFVLAVVVLDFASYLAHRFFHATGFTWRIHRVHHCESDLDLTTGFRFHPLESVIGQLLFFAVIVPLGPPAAAVAFIAIANVVQDYIHHANVRVPDSLDRVLRVLIATPGVHRVHHSVVVAEQNANYGIVFSVWDRMFGTFADVDTANMPFGLTEVEGGSALGPRELLLLPLRPTSASVQKPVVPAVQERASAR